MVLRAQLAADPGIAHWQAWSSKHPVARVLYRRTFSGCQTQGRDTMHLELVKLDDIHPQRWRNQQGRTRELLVWPRDAAEGWSVRISVADVDAGGPFSAYAGIDRWIALVSGAGMRLQWDGVERRVDPDGAPLPFEGETAPACALIDGATRDLNLMIRRERGTGGMLRVVDGVEHASAASLRAVFATGAARLHIDAEPGLPLPPMTLAWSDQAAHQRWRLQPDTPQTHAWWMHYAHRTRP